MINSRVGLLLLGTVFGVWEAVDTFRIDVPAAAAVFAALFLCATAWFWRRGSRPPVFVLMFLFAFEVAVAPSWKHASTGMKATAIVLGVAGFLTGMGVLWSGRRAARDQMIAT
jgi:hypothetical protein